MINVEKLTRDELEDLMERCDLDESCRYEIRRGPYPFGMTDKHGEPVFSHGWYHFAVGELQRRADLMGDEG